MPECFKVVCILCKALYKCSALPFTFICYTITKLLHNQQDKHIHRLPNSKDCTISEVNVIDTHAHYMSTGYGADPGIGNQPTGELSHPRHYATA